MTEEELQHSRNLGGLSKNREMRMCYELANLINQQRSRIAELEAENERLRGQIRQTAIDFADYMQSYAWKYDYKEQKTHNLSEHFERFSNV